MRTTTRLRALIDAPEILVAPGVYDAYLARLVEEAGFQAVYMTGAGVTHSTLGRPDVGLLGFSEMADRAARIAEATSLPLIADADTGYGNAMNARRTVRAYERAGVAGLHLEDQVAPKQCGHFDGKQVIGLDEMLGKLRAALDARTDPHLFVIARTDARTVLGFEAALERAQAMAEAGADMIFLESPRSVEELRAVAGAVNAPLLANMVETGKTPLLPAAELQALGYAAVIFPGALGRFLGRQARGFLADLRATGTTAGRLDEMLTFAEQNEIVGLPDVQAMARRYGAHESEG